MDAQHLHAAIAEVCPVLSCRVDDPVDRSKWFWQHKPEATQAQIDAGNNVVATIPAAIKTVVVTADFIARWTNAEYLAVQKLRTTDNGRTAKSWDICTSDNIMDMNKKKVIALKDDLIAAGVITAARAEELFA